MGTVIPVLADGEFGGDLTAFLYRDSATGTSVLVDCGVPPGTNGAMLEKLQEMLAHPGLQGVVVSHAHLDHWSMLDLVPPGIPVFTTRLILHYLMKADGYRRRDGLSSIVPTQLRMFSVCDTIQVGGFTVETIPVPHSVPETMMLVIRTPSGKVVVHGSDFKFHGMTEETRAPLEERLRAFGSRERLAHLTCDLFNAHVDGFTSTEGRVIDELEAICREMSAAGRQVLIACFSSNHARIQATRARLAAQGIRTFFTGAAMGFTSSLLPHVEVPHRRPDCGGTVAFVTGCQGEEGSVLWKAVNHAQPKFAVVGDETVVLSSRSIGTEGRITPILQALLARGCTVIVHEGERAKLHLDHARLQERCVHVSGHGSADDLRLLLQCLKPARVRPQPHLEPQLTAFRAIAAEAGVEMMEPDGHTITV